MIKLIIWIIANLLSTFSITYFYYKLTDTKKIKLKAVILFITGFILVSFLEYLEIKMLSTILFFAFYPILFYMINPLPIRKVIYYMIAIWLIGMSFDLISMLVVSIIYYFSKFEVYTYWVETGFTFFVSLMLIVLSYNKKFKAFINKVYNKIHNIKYSDLSLIIFSAFTLLMAIILFLNVNNLTIDLLLTLLLLLVVISFIILIKHKINMKENLQYLKTLKDNNDFYIKVDEDNRIFKHNLLAKLLSIKSVSNKKATLLIDDLIKQFTKSEKLDNGIRVIPYGLNGIIYQKVYPYLKEFEINILNEVEYDIFDVLNPRKYNVFVEKIIIAIDNAIEASLKSKEKIIVIHLYDNKNEIMFEIKNTFGGNINIDELGAKKFSTKGKRRGLGLFSALRNNEATLTVGIINNLFVSKITVKKKLIN